MRVVAIGGANGVSVCSSPCGKRDSAPPGIRLTSKQIEMIGHEAGRRGSRDFKRGSDVSLGPEHGQGTDRARAVEGRGAQDIKQLKIVAGVCCWPARVAGGVWGTRLRFVLVGVAGGVISGEDKMFLTAGG